MLQSWFARFLLSSQQVGSAAFAWGSTKCSQDEEAAAEAFEEVDLVTITGCGFHRATDGLRVSCKHIFRGNSLLNCFYRSAFLLSWADEHAHDGLKPTEILLVSSVENVWIKYAGVTTSYNKERASVVWNRSVRRSNQGSASAIDLCAETGTKAIRINTLYQLMQFSYALSLINVKRCLSELLGLSILLTLLFRTLREL